MVHMVSDIGSSMEDITLAWDIQKVPNLNLAPHNHDNGFWVMSVDL